MQSTEGQSIQPESQQNGLLGEVAQNRGKLSDIKLENPALIEGMWILNIVNGDIDHKASNVKDRKVENSNIRWSVQLRRLLGYEKPYDIPNNWNSWVNAVHANAIDRAAAIFSSRLAEGSGNTSYKAEYCLKTAPHRYVWFMAYDYM